MTDLTPDEVRARAVLDGITGPIILDDSQVTALHVIKRRARHGEKPGVLITIQEDKQ